MHRCSCRGVLSLSLSLSLALWDSLLCLRLSGIRAFSLSSRRARKHCSQRAKRRGRDSRGREVKRDKEEATWWSGSGGRLIESRNLLTHSRNGRARVFSFCFFLVNARASRGDSRSLFLWVKGRRVSFRKGCFLYLFFARARRCCA